MTNAQIQKIVSGEGSKSSKMIALYGAGMEIKAIAEVMGTRYNFVYNVVSNHCNMNSVELRTNKATGKSDAILELHKQGKSLKEIAIELKTNYNYVHKIVSAHKKEQEQKAE